MPNGWTSGVPYRGYYFPGQDDDPNAATMPREGDQMPTEEDPVMGYPPMPAEGEERSPEAPTPQPQQTEQGLWDQIAKDMDTFQQHAAPGYRPPSEPKVPQTMGEEPQERTASPNVYGGMMGIPRLVTGDDGKAYLADNDGKQLTVGGNPVSFDDYYRHVHAAGVEGDPMEQWTRAMDHETAAFNSSMLRMIESGTSPQQFDAVHGMIGDRERKLQQLMLQIHNDPNLDERSRAVAARHLYQQMGQLALHQQAAVQKKQELMTPLSVGERGTMNRLMQSASWLDRQIGSGDLDGNDPQIQQMKRNVQGQMQQLRAREQFGQQVQQQQQYQQAEQQVHHIQTPDGQNLSFIMDAKGTPHFAPKENASEMRGHIHGFDGLPYETKAKMINDHLEKYGGSHADAVAHYRQMDQAIGLPAIPGSAAGVANITHPTQDPEHYLRGKVALQPHELAQMRAGLTPDQVKHYHNIATAGDQYGWMSVEDPDPANASYIYDDEGRPIVKPGGQLATKPGTKIVRDPEGQAYQQRAQQLLGLTPAGTPIVPAQPQKIGRPMTQQQWQTLQDKRTKAIEKAMEDYGLAQDDAESIVTPQGDLVAGRLQKVKPQDKWDNAHKAAENHIDALLKTNEMAAEAHKNKMATEAAKEEGKRANLGEYQQRYSMIGGKKVEHTPENRDRLIEHHMVAGGWMAPGGARSYDAYVDNMGVKNYLALQEARQQAWNRAHPQQAEYMRQLEGQRGISVHGPSAGPGGAMPPQPAQGPMRVAGGDALAEHLGKIRDQAQAAGDSDGVWAAKFVHETLSKYQNIREAPDWVKKSYLAAHAHLRDYDPKLKPVNETDVGLDQPLEISDWKGSTGH